VLDPFKLAILSIHFWARLIGGKRLLILTALSTVVVLILGCRETYF
jgi:hypothetical protein